ncbi:MAG: hypothetical protein AAGF94_00405 [Pseudomonadota bacterium]
MKAVVFSATALCAATPALAEWVTVACSFKTQCYEADACDDAALLVKLSAGDTPGTVQMRSPEETVIGTPGGSDTTSLTWIAETETAVHLMSWGADGSARYSLHLTLGPAVVSYLGSCEAEK